MTDDEPARADEPAAKLSDPVPATGEHPGGPHRDEEPFPAVAAGVRECLSADASGHDMHHVWRVFRLARRFAGKLGADVPLPAVQHCVAVHDDLAFRGDDPAPETLEAEILRDADNLDAMGAVGVARTFAFGGAHGTPLWDPDGEEDSQLNHFEDKLLRLTGELHTEPARELAAGRHAFLEEFYDRFRAEWRGDA